MLIAFGVKLPIVPLHTWLPDAHGEATAPVHMLLAGILLKMGGYALFRFNASMFPDAHVQFAPLLVVLGVVNIIYARSRRLRSATSNARSPTAPSATWALC